VESKVERYQYTHTTWTLSETFCAGRKVRLKVLSIKRKRGTAWERSVLESRGFDFCGGSGSG